MSYYIVVLNNQNYFTLFIILSWFGWSLLCVCVGKEVFCYNQIHFGSIVLCLQYFHTLGGYFLCVGRQVFCSIQNDTCIGIKHIYIYIERERERERPIKCSIFLPLYFFLHYTFKPPPFIKCSRLNC